MSKETIIKLTPSEMLLAYQVAAMRAVQNVKFNAQPKYGGPKDVGAEEINVIGCRGEIAVAKALNLYWAGSIGNYGARDVGGLVEVRARRKDHHKLILHDEDADGLPFVLCHVSMSTTVRIIGWCFTEEGKRAEYRQDPVGGRPAYFVPAEALRPLHELKRWTAEWLMREFDH
jgi:hypothetical protein